MPRKQHYLLLAAIITLSAALRFTGLDSKPLWLDEIITTLFSLGHSFTQVPLNKIFSLAELPDIFTFNPQATCQTIAETVATESTHPPIFFCLLHWWLGRIRETATLPELVWQVRSLPAFFGVVTVAAIYYLGRVAFSPNTGLLAATFMAVSPFAVYLSQEARHYTLPLLLITLALIGLIQIQQDIALLKPPKSPLAPLGKEGIKDESPLAPLGKEGIRVGAIEPKPPFESPLAPLGKGGTRIGGIRPTIWIFWVIFNTIGLYIHYFFILALAAQIGAIFLWHLWQNIQADRKPESFQILAIVRQLIPSIWHFAFCILPLILFLPWFPILLEHFNRPETAWFKPFEPSWVDNIVPISQIILGWILMAIALPVENQPLWIAIPCGILMLGFAIGLGRTVWQKLPQLFTNPAFQDSSLILGIFTGLVLAEFLIIVYILGKDITSAVRYHFIYYPSICVLLAACFSSDGKNRSAGESTQKHKYIKFSDKLVILLGLISSLFVISGLVFQKPYNPQQVAKHLNLEPEKPLMVLVGYDSFQEVALGLGFAWEVYQQRNQTLSPLTSWMFVDRTEGYHTLWPKLQTLPNITADEDLNLWVIAPGLRQKQYPPNLQVSGLSCAIDSNQYYRLGIPYQLYRCSPSNTNFKN